jgi:hypothetical protein
MVKFIFLLFASFYTSCLLWGCRDSSGKEKHVSPDSDDGHDTGDVDAGIDTAGTTDHDSTSNADTNGDTERDNGYRLKVSLSEKIPTVGIVEWSFDETPLTEARIEYGRNDKTEYTAPVDMSDPNHRTLLLGMKPSTEYLFRIVATDGTTTYKSGDHPIVTGSRPTGLPSQTITGTAPDYEGGFIITSSYTSGWVFIMDGDGDYVWWYKSGNTLECMRAKMTYDGEHVIIANGNIYTNVPEPDAGTLIAVSMDGLEERVFDVTKRHHDAEVLPGGEIAYFEYETTGPGTCDRVMEMSPDGSTRQVFMVRDHFDRAVPDEEWCHSNAINYLPEEDAYTLSILNMNTIVKFDRNGTVLWVLGGDDSDFPGVSWVAQHQHQWLGDSILLFNNRGTGGGLGVASRAIEYSVDESTLEASLIWEYASGQMSSMAMGDAKRLPGGNTLVVFSASGTIQEVSPSKEIIRQITYSMGNAVGYVEWRESLFGPPQKYL